VAWRSILSAKDDHSYTAPILASASWSSLHVFQQRIRATTHSHACGVGFIGLSNIHPVNGLKNWAGLVRLAIIVIGLASGLVMLAHELRR